MNQKKNKLLITSFFLSFLLVLSVSCVVVQPSMSAGMWSNPLPTVDGQVSVDDMQRSSHIQLSDVDIYSHFGEAVGTCNFSLFLAGNGTHVYVGVNISNVPFLANLVIDWGAPEPQVVSGNATVVTVRFDNDGNGTLDLNEDRKQIQMFNSSFKLASDDYWDGDDYDRDDQSGPGTGNITDFNITHSDMSAQGNIGNITTEMVFVNGSDPEGKDGGGIVGDTTTITVDFMVMGVGSGGNPIMLYQASTAGLGPEEDVSGFETITGPIGNLAGDVTGFFNIYDGTITSTEAGNAEFKHNFLDVTLYGPPADWTTDVDVYVVNNGTHLYVGVVMEEVPYYANVTWTNPNGPPDPNIPHNITFISVKFDNNNNDVIDASEDAKQVILGNNTLTIGDDMFWNTTGGADYSSDSGSDFPPDPGNMTAFAASHSNTATQGNIGEFTVELVMLLSDDPMGYDGGGLSGTVGFSIAYQAFINIVFDPNGPPSSIDGEFFSEFSGMVEEDNNASLFWDLVIKDSNPSPSIDSPDDISYEEGATENSIEWTPTDTNPYKYSITKDGVVVEEGYWDSGVAISIDVDGLSVGDYTYVCTVNDTGGNSASDEVTVTVTEPTVSEFPFGYAFIALITLPLIALIAYRKTRKLKV